MTFKIYIERNWGMNTENDHVNNSLEEMRDSN